MINNGLKFFLLGIIFIILQIILDEFVNNWYMVYISLCPLFILSLPISMPKGSYMLVSFLVGLSIDIFSGGLLGLNAAAAVAVAFVRMPILRLLFSYALLENLSVITINSVRTKSFIFVLFLINIIFFSVYILLDVLFTIPFYLFAMWLLINLVLNVIFSYIAELLFVNKFILRYRE